MALFPAGAWNESAGEQAIRPPQSRRILVRGQMGIDAVEATKVGKQTHPEEGDDHRA